MLYAWAPLNAGGHTKKVTTTAIFFVAQCVGNIVGPQVYQPSMAPEYTPGLIVEYVLPIAFMRRLEIHMFVILYQPHLLGPTRYRCMVSTLL